MSCHPSSFPHTKVTSEMSWLSLDIFLPSLIPPFHPLTIPFAVRRSTSIPGAGFSCPATHPHRHTPRSHPECPDHLSTSSNSRAHLRPTFKDTPKIGSLKAGRSLSDHLSPNSPEENVEIQQNSNIFSNQQKPKSFKYVYLKPWFPSIVRKTLVYTCTTYPQSTIQHSTRQHGMKVDERRRRDLLPTPGLCL